MFGLVWSSLVYFGTGIETHNFKNLLDPLMISGPACESFLQS